MKHAFTLMALLGTAILNAQSFRDPDNDMEEGSTVYREDKGQLRTTGGATVERMAARSEGPAVHIYCGQQSDLHYVWRAVHGDSGVADTSFHIAMRVSGEAGNPVAPAANMPAPGIANYYRGDTAIDSVRAWHAYHYSSVNPYVDMRAYHGRYGPKLAFIFHPGSDPADLLLEFDGLDSLDVDVNGALKMYMAGKWLQFNQAIAYQIIGNTVVPVNWAPEFQHYDNTDVVRFVLGAYDHELPLVVRIAAPGGPPPPSIPEPRNLGWSTYAGSDQGDEFMATGVDNNDDVYVCGYTDDINFPVGTGFQVFAANQPSFQGNHDAVVMKFRHTDKRILWATYVGGTEVGFTDYDDVGIDQAVDLAVYRGEDADLAYVFVTGSTGCNDFQPINSPGTPFANAVHDAWLCTDNVVHAAFITAFQQDNGHMDWAHTLGAGTNGFWTANGLGVDVNDDGKVVWGGSLLQVFCNETFDFPYVTPTGAYTQACGGGFFAEFDAAYQYKWLTPFGSVCHDAGVHDVKLTRYAGVDFADLVGTALSTQGGQYIYSLDIATPTGFTGFQQTTGGGGTDAYLARLRLDTRQNYYSTFWGGSGNDFGKALASYDKRIWIAGGTLSTDIDAAHLPGNGGVHDDTPGGGMDGFMLKFEANTPSPDLAFGSLYGGAGNEIWMDLDYYANAVYFIGESNSPGAIVFPDNASLYRQDQLGNEEASTHRDAVLLAIQEITQLPIWNTFIGGFWTDRGQGVAASTTELYVCGGTRSDQLTFPLREWNVNAPEDWFDGDLSNNIGGDQGWYAFSGLYFYNFYDQGAPPYELGAPQTHDGFITCFAAAYDVGFAPAPGATDGALVRLLDPDGLWWIPMDGHSTVRVHDASGRLVMTAGTNGTVDLRPFGSGIYIAIRTDGHGGSRAIKLYRP